jgi:hypothetical protein
MIREEAVQIFLNKVRLAYVDDQKAKGIVSSGKSAESLKTTVSPTLGQLLGAAYFTQQKLGRRPGKFPPIEAIIQWLKDKKTFNVEGDKGPSLKSLAFLIARKISKQGTDIYLKKRPALSVEDKILEARKELAMNVGNIAKQKLIDAINQRKSA